jgi:hypothetical protein
MNTWRSTSESPAEACDCRAEGISPAYFFRQLQKVASLIPALRQTSSIGVQSPACFKTNAICASVNFDARSGSVCLINFWAADE